MKPIYNSYPKPKAKLLLLFVAAITLTSLFASCTADEIEVNQKNEILKEGYLQRNDSIVRDSILYNPTNTTAPGEIIPPTLPTTPPVKP